MALPDNHFQPSTLSNLLQNPAADLARELQERQKKLLAATQVGGASPLVGRSAKLSDFMSPYTAQAISPF
jgi:hypothetical protein